MRKFVAKFLVGCDVGVVVVSSDAAADTATDTATDTAAETATESHKWSAVKSPLGAQTVLGDRHDLVCEILFASAVGRLRNSPERTFQRLGTQADAQRI